MSFTRDNWDNSIGGHQKRYGTPLSIVHFIIIGVMIGFLTWVYCQF